MKISTEDARVLTRILKHCDNVAQDLSNVRTVEELRHNDLVKRALTCSLTRIGRLVDQDLSTDLKISRTEITWYAIIATSEELLDSDEQDPSELWKMATSDIPELREFILKSRQEQNHFGGSGKLQLH